jgi:carbon-monoxide dehydrogenase small subunit
MQLNCVINGHRQTLEIKADDILLDVLRNAGLKGTRKGCGTGACGACTVLINRQPHLACQTFAAKVEGMEIITIEGLAQNGNIHPLQKAFAENGGLQCGFCISGTMLASLALLEETPNPTDNEIRAALSGNLCRCTGYVKQIESVKKAAAILRGEDKNE